MEGISILQQAGLSQNQTFVNQVNGVVKQEALYKAEFTPGLSQRDRDILASAARDPGNFGFAAVIVADTTWALTFDVWAADPEASKGTIQGGVQKAWPLLVGAPESNPTP